MWKVTDYFGSITEHDIVILKDICEACSQRHLPEFMAGKFCMENYCPGLLAQLAAMKPVPIKPAMYTFKDATKGLQELSNTYPNAIVRDMEVSRPVVDVTPGPLECMARGKDLPVYREYAHGDMMYINLSIMLNEGGPVKRNWKHQRK